MRRLLILFAILGLISTGCRYAYAARTVVECGGRQAVAWGEGTLARQEEMESDMRAADAALQSSTYLELDSPDDLIWMRQEMQPYVSRAKARYLQQTAEATPACLKRMQELTAEVFYLDWKMYDALQHGDTDLAEERQEQWLAATDAVWREYERLVAKYRWEE
jgi:hypothetical protein